MSPSQFPPPCLGEHTRTYMHTYTFLLIFWSISFATRWVCFGMFSIPFFRCLSSFLSHIFSHSVYLFYSRAKHLTYLSCFLGKKHQLFILIWLVGKNRQFPSQVEQLKYFAYILFWVYSWKNLITNKHKSLYTYFLLAMVVVYGAHLLPHHFFVSWGKLHITKMDFLSLVFSSLLARVGKSSSRFPILSSCFSDATFTRTAAIISPCVLVSLLIEEFTICITCNRSGKGRKWNNKDHKKRKFLFLSISIHRYHYRKAHQTRERNKKAHWRLSRIYVFGVPFE